MPALNGLFLYLAGLLAALLLVSTLLLRFVSREREQRHRLRRILDERRRQGVHDSE